MRGFSVKGGIHKLHLQTRSAAVTDTPLSVMTPVAQIRAAMKQFIYEEYIPVNQLFLSHA